MKCKKKKNDWLRKYGKEKILLELDENNQQC